MAHSTPLYCGNSSMARSALAPCGTPSTAPNLGQGCHVLQAQGAAYSNPQILRATSQVDKFRLKVEDYDKIVQYLEIPENFALLHGAGKKTRVGGSDDEEDQSASPSLPATPTVILTEGLFESLARPYLRKHDILVRIIIFVVVVRRTNELDCIMLQIRQCHRHISAHGMATREEVVRAATSVPVLVLLAHILDVTPHKFYDARLRSDTKVVAHDVNRERQIKEVRFS
ncbi:unnamed protein product [Calypogeia fissa]